MNNSRTHRLLWIVAVGLVLTGVGLAVGAWRDLGDKNRLLREKIAEIRELQILESDVRQFQDARQLFERLPDKRPALLEDRVAGSGLKFKIRTISETPGCAPGWTVRQKEVDLTENELSLARIMEFVALVEDGMATDGAKAPARVPSSPPWRLARCILRASSRTPGLVEAILVFESLEKTGNS